MSTIIIKTKHKKIETDKSLFIFNFNSINIHVFSVVLFVICLFFGYIYYDDKYCQFNQLPDDRNELMPVKQMNLSISTECILKTEIKIQSIAKQTFSNLFQNINVRILEKGQSHSDHSAISTKNADSVISTSQSFCFSKKLRDHHNFTAQIHLFDEPIGKKYTFSC